MGGQGRAPVLLYLAGYYGALAAARCLGEQGIPVVVADSRKLAFAKWSRYVTRRDWGPPLGDTDEILTWLLDVGKREPGYVLYPTNDDMAWLIAAHRETLSPHFKLYSPPLHAVRTLLDKELLGKACDEVGIRTPKTYYPRSPDALREVAEHVDYPAVIKRITQVFSAGSGHKGKIVSSKEELLSSYMGFVQDSGYSTQFLEEDPNVAWPMIQTYHTAALGGVYYVTGFIDDTGNLWDLRASRKVFQYPRKLGIGTAFEETVLEATLRDNLITLCRSVGYYGVFSIEFLEREPGGDYLLIDFNPRLDHAIWFDIVRDMPLPLFVYYGAVSDREAMRLAVEESRRNGPSIDRRALINTLMFGLEVFAQTASRYMSLSETRQWISWYRSHIRHDMAFSRRDPLPSALIALDLFQSICKHPRSFARAMLWDR